MLTRNYQNKTWRLLEEGEKVQKGDICRTAIGVDGLTALTCDMRECWAAFDLGRTIRPGDMYFRVQQTHTHTTEETMLNTNTDQEEVTIPVTPENDTPSDFSAFLSPAFSDWLNGLIDERAKALVSRAIERELPDHVDSALERELGDAVEDQVTRYLDNACFDDHFDIADAVADAVNDYDFSDQCEEAVGNYLDYNSSVIEEAVQDSLGATTYIEEAVDSFMSDNPVDVDKQVRKSLAAILNNAAQSL